MLRIFMKVEHGLKERVRRHCGAYGSARAAWRIIKEDCRDAGLTKGEAKQCMVDEIEPRVEPFRNLVWDVSYNLFGITLGEDILGRYLEKALNFVSGPRFPNFVDVAEVARANRHKMGRYIKRDDFYRQFHLDRLASLEGGLDSL